MSVLPKVFGTAGAPASAPAGVGPNDAADLLRAGAAVVDVRESDEWVAGHVPDAEHHPLGGLATSMAHLPRDRTLVVVCRSGNRSARATALLVGSGFDAVNLVGGMAAWNAAGLTLVDARGATGVVR